MDDSAAYRIEYLYDFRLVRSFEIAGDAYFRRLAAYSRNSYFLGNSLFRVLSSGSSQSYRLKHKRRPFQPHPVEGDSGSNQPYRVHGNRNTLFQGRKLPLEPSRRVLLPHPRSILQLFEVDAFIKN